MKKTLRKIRIGIDVGGTFTDAVAIDAGNHSIVGRVKIPTTHSDKGGVAKGVVDSLMKIIEEGNIRPEEITFIAHGTTQATNALLEGDVAKVGIVGMGSGLEGKKAKADTVFAEIPVSMGKAVPTKSVFLDTTNEATDEEIRELVKELTGEGCRVIVASEAFSVDRPENEQAVLKICREEGLECTGGHEISKLYGLKARTRTAVINASILPKMIATAVETKRAVEDAHITSPLMIMRCDGGVMKIDEMKKRPILTILSGPAAGVAGALMYEKVSDGIFLEVGGTSTDISAIKNGKVMINYAQVGGHKTYVTSLDVRTVGIGGGSMVRVHGDKIADVGPRSAHIANCGYCVYAEPEVIKKGSLELISPLEDDPKEYAVIVGADGKRYAITMSCAANYLEYVTEGDYAFGNKEAAAYGIEMLAEYLHKNPREAAAEILKTANDKNEKVVRGLIKDYELDMNLLQLTGGGGGASTVLWHLAEQMKVTGRLAQNAPIISTIGAALAMVRDVVERTIIDPNEEDLIRIREEAEQAAIMSGANPRSIEVDIAIDTALNRVRAIAMGTTELVRKEEGSRGSTPEEQKALVAKALGLESTQDIRQVAGNGFFRVYEGTVKKSGFLKWLGGRETILCVTDNEGIMKLKIKNGLAQCVKSKVLKEDAFSVVKKYAAYDESGERTPDVFVLSGSKMTEYKGIGQIKNLAALIQTESRKAADGQDVILVVHKRE